MSEEQMVVFRVAGEEYAIPIAETKEILQVQEPTKLPNSPAYLEGLINVRGHIIPVVRLSAKFGLVDEVGSAQRVIVTEVGTREIGIIVDEVLEVIHLSGVDLEPTPDVCGAAGSGIRGIGKVDSRLIILLNFEQLFTGEEMATFSQQLA